MKAQATKPAEPDYSQVKAKISLKAYIMASLFAAKHDIRYYLNGITIERADGGTYVVASDGHTMLVFYDEQGSLDGADSIIVKAPHAAVMAARMASRKKEPQAVIVEGKRLSIAPEFGMAHSGDLELYVLPGSCQIPPPDSRSKFDWKRVVPEFAKLKRGLIGTVNPTYLARLEQAARVGVASRYASGVWMWQADENSVAAVQFERHPEALGLIMPMRSDRGIDFGLLTRVAKLREKAKQEAESAAAAAKASTSTDSTTTAPKEA